MIDDVIFLFFFMDFYDDKNFDNIVLLLSLINSDYGDFGGLDFYVLFLENINIEKYVCEIEN